MKDINFLNLKCDNSTAKKQKVRSKEQIYTIRLLPHAIDEGTNYAFDRSIKRHKLPNGSEVVCSGLDCPYCADGIKSYITNYMVADLLNSTSDFPNGVYVLVYDSNFAMKLSRFKKAVSEQYNIDISSLYDDGCFFNVNVFKGNSARVNYEFSVYTKGRYSKDISSESDIINFVNSENMPELDKFINKENLESEKKDESYFDSIVSAFTERVIGDEFGDFSKNAGQSIIDVFKPISKDDGNIFTETVDKSATTSDFDEFISDFDNILQ